MATEKIEIRDRLTGAVKFTAEIECAETASAGVKLGLAVIAALAAGADLTGANLAGANLTRADLIRAYLTGAYLTGAYLTGAYLTDANLTRANLAGANLAGADLTGANLAGAYLTGADLTGADLTRANLAGADLTGADLTGAYLTGADLTRADLGGAIGVDRAIAKTRILPAGQIIGWKKLRDGTIAKLSIPAEARRSHAFGRKCRAEFADVLEGTGESKHERGLTYAPGARVTCHEWDDDWRNECSGGIHFFITREEAEAY